MASWIMNSLEGGYGYRDLHRDLKSGQDLATIVEQHYSSNNQVKTSRLEGHLQTLFEKNERLKKCPPMGNLHALGLDQGDVSDIRQRITPLVLKLFFHDQIGDEPSRRDQQFIRTLSTNAIYERVARKKFHARDLWDQLALIREHEVRRPSVDATWALRGLVKRGVSAEFLRADLQRLSPSLHEFYLTTLHRLFVDQKIPGDRVAEMLEFIQGRDKPEDHAQYLNLVLRLAKLLRKAGLKEDLLGQTVVAIMDRCLDSSRAPTKVATQMLEFLQASNYAHRNPEDQEFLRRAAQDLSGMVSDLSPVGFRMRNWLTEARKGPRPQDMLDLTRVCMKTAGGRMTAAAVDRLLDKVETVCSQYRRKDVRRAVAELREERRERAEAGELGGWNPIQALQEKCTGVIDLVDVYDDE